MTTRTDTLKVRLETDDDGKVHASLARVATDSDKVSQSSGATKKAMEELAGANAESEQSFLKNSRAITSFQDLLDDLVSGQLGRAKREVAALANETGLLARVFSGGGAAIGMLAGPTAIAVAVAAMTYAYVKGAEESDKFTRALYATGQQSMVTAGQLEDVVSAVGTSTGSYGKSADALTLLVNSGRYTREEFANLSRAVVNFSELTGGDLADGMRVLDSLTGQVGDGLLKLDAQYHFLTATVYDQIAALQLQGETDKARALEQKTWADATNQRADEVKQHLGYLATAWGYVTTEAAKAWHTMMAWGEQESTVKQIGEITAGLNQKLAADAFNKQDPDKDSQVIYLRRKLSDLNLLLQNQKDWQQQAEDADKRMQDHEKALNGFLATDKHGVEGFVAQAAEINKKRLLALAGVVDPSVRDQVNAAADQQIRDAMKRANDQLPHGGHGGTPPGVTALNTFSQYVNGLSAQSDGAQFDDAALGKYVTGVEKLYDGFKETIAKSADVNKTIAEYDRGIQKLGADLAKTRDQQAKADAAFNAQLDDQLRLRQNAIDLQVMSVGMGAKEVQRMQELNQVHQQFNTQLAQLNRERDRGSITLQQYQARLDDLNAHERATIAALQDGYTRLDAAQEDWRNGLIGGMQDWIDQGNNVAGQTAQMFTNAFGSMNDALVNFVTTSKLNFGDFAKSVIADLARMELRVIESQILQSILGAFATGPSGANMGYFGTYSQTATDQTSGGIVDSIMGGRAGGGPVAGGSLYEVAEGGKPEILNAGGHTYLLMGPQGGTVEPAQRGDTQPAITGQCGGGRGGDVFQFHFETHVDGNGVQSQQGGGTSRSEAAKQLNDQMRTAATDVLMRAMQPGGVLWKQRVGQIS